MEIYDVRVIDDGGKRKTLNWFWCKGSPFTYLLEVKVKSTIDNEYICESISRQSVQRTKGQGKQGAFVNQTHGESHLCSVTSFRAKPRHLHSSPCLFLLIQSSPALLHHRSPLGTLPSSSFILALPPFLLFLERPLSPSSSSSLFLLPTSDRLSMSLPSPPPPTLFRRARSILPGGAPWRRRA